MRKTTFLSLLLLYLSCQPSAQKNSDMKPTQQQAEIIETYLKKGAWNHHYVTKEWQEWIDKGLEKDSTIALLWQQKALPYWKTRKYELAVAYFDKAVLYNRRQYLSRRGFLKCIFPKTYKSALEDLEAYQREFGETYENDHSLTFYRGLCHLGLNEYDAALALFKQSIEREEREKGKDWVHYLDRFYLGIAYYELNDYYKAIDALDDCLDEYPAFSDAKFWKGKCLVYIGEKTQGEQLMREGKQNYVKGNTFNEGSSQYELYPYQLSWEWNFLVK
jgi:tetratricopeptide (TPR) repeat protein